MEFFNKFIKKIDDCEYDDYDKVTDYNEIDESKIIINNLMKENENLLSTNEELKNDNNSYKNSKKEYEDVNFKMKLEIERLMKENNELENKHKKNINKIKDEYDIEIKELKEENTKLIDNKKVLKSIHKEANKFEIIKTNMNTIISKYKLINWEKNRPVCDTRVNDITKYYKDNNIKIIPGIIYVWYNNEKYKITDGLHRYTAALQLDKNIKVILHINYSTNEQEIIDEFININKSIAIPSIYLEDNQIKKTICESVVKQLCTKYPNFKSPSRKHFVYNFNRDLLIEYFSTFNLNFNITNLDNKIFDMLMVLNKQAKHNVITGKIVHPKKCKNSDFYLFYLEKYHIKTEIENNIKLLN